MRLTVVKSTAPLLRFYLRKELDNVTAQNSAKLDLGHNNLKFYRGVVQP